MYIFLNDNGRRILHKDNHEEVNIHDNDIIQYTGIYYTPVEIQNIATYNKIETLFIGKVETYRSNYESGIKGIYVTPLYIWNKIDNEWNKMIETKPVPYKYFLYPHLLLLPEYTYHYHPLYFLHTCENKNLCDFTHITKVINN
jgi:hypothetical protein